MLSVIIFILICTLSNSIWLNEKGDEIGVSEITHNLNHTLICPFILIRKVVDYSPPAGCALLSELVTRYLKKGESTIALVVCSSNKSPEVYVTCRLLNFSFHLFTLYTDHSRRSPFD